MNRTPGYHPDATVEPIGSTNNNSATNDHGPSTSTSGGFEEDEGAKRGFHKSRHTWSDNLFTADMLDDLNFNFGKLGSSSGNDSDDKVGNTSTGLFDTIDALKGPSSGLNPANDAVVGSHPNHRRAESMSSRVGSGLMGRAFAFSNSLGNGVDLIPPPISVSVKSKSERGTPNSPTSSSLEHPLGRASTYHALGPVPIVDSSDSPSMYSRLRAKANRSIGSPGELDLDGIVEEHGRIQELRDLQDSHSLHKRRVTFGGMQEFSPDVFSSGIEGFKLGESNSTNNTVSATATAVAPTSWGSSTSQDAVGVGRHSRSSSSIAQGHPLYLGEKSVSQNPATSSSNSNGASNPILSPIGTGSGASIGTPNSSPLSSPSPGPPNSQLNSSSSPTASGTGPNTGMNSTASYFEPQTRAGSVPTSQASPTDWSQATSPDGSYLEGSWDDMSGFGARQGQYMNQNGLNPAAVGGAYQQSYPVRPPLPSVPMGHVPQMDPMYLQQSMQHPGMQQHGQHQHIMQQQQQQLAAQYAFMQQLMANQGKPMHNGGMMSPDIAMQMAMGSQSYGMPGAGVPLPMPVQPPQAHQMRGQYGRHGNMNGYQGAGKSYNGGHSPRRGAYQGRNGAPGGHRGKQAGYQAYSGGGNVGGYQQGGKHRGGNGDLGNMANACDCLIEYKTSGRRPAMSELTGHVVEFSRDAHGSRFIQYKMETAPEHEKQQLIDEVLDEAVSLMQDTFGNYVIQNFLEHGTEAQRVALSNTMCGSMYALSAQAHGCRVVQRAFDLLETNLPQRNKLLQELLLPNGHVAKCSKNSHATHVLQKAVNILISEVRSSDPAVAELARKSYDNVRSAHQLLDAVEEAVHDSFASLAMHPHAYRLVLSVLGNCSDDISPWVGKMVRQVEPLQMSLATDQHGNFVLQHILDVGSREQQDGVQAFVTMHILELSQHKFGSHLVEKCLDCSNTTQAGKMIAEILVPSGPNLAHAKRASTSGKVKNQLAPPQGGSASSAPSALVIMMQDPYANFVVQKAFDKSSGQQRAALAKEILSRSEMLSKFTYGRHILSHINREGGQALVANAAKQQNNPAH